MKKIYELIETAELISRKLTKNSTKTDTTEFQSWLNHSSHNRKLYEKIKDKKNKQKRDDLFNTFDTEKAWTNFLLSLDKEPRKIKFLKFSRRIAAILLPLIIIGGVLISVLNIEKDQIALNTTAITPGKKGAVLILNDGRILSLKSLQSGDIIKQGNTDIIKLVDGKLMYNRKNANTPPPVSLYKGEVPEQINTLLTSRGEEYSLTLSDGSKVFVNSMTKLQFPVRFSSNKREVFLEGEAYFEVTKDTERPFIVNVNNKAEVKVLGTHFNINAYEDETSIKTTLLEGAVQISPVRLKLQRQLDYSQTESDKITRQRAKSSLNSSEPFSFNPLVLKPGEQAILCTDGKLTVAFVDTKRITQWKDGIYSFTNQPLNDIMKTLSRWYDLEYEFENEALKELCFEGGLNKYDEIGPILDIMQSTGKVKIKVKGHKIVFM